MGNIHGKASKSRGICIDIDKHQHTSILFPEQATNIVTTLLMISDVSTKFRVDYGPRGLPVVGFFWEQPDLKNMWLQDDDDPNSTYWYLSTGKFISEGKVQSQLLPVCKPGAEIEISRTVLSASVLLTVHNPGTKPESASLKLPYSLTKALPFMGAVRTGMESMRFVLLSNAGYQPDPTFTDLTNKTKFEASEGVMSISSDRQTLTRATADQGNGYALLNQIIRSGIHRIELKVTSDFGASLCIGVARYPFKLSLEYIKDQSKHIYRHPNLILWRSYRGLLYYDGKQLDSVTEALGWQNGRVIHLELIINMDRRTIEIVKDEKSLGVIFTDIPEAVQPVVCYYAAYEKCVKLVSYKATPTLESSSLQSLDPRVSEDVMPSNVAFDVSSKIGLMNITGESKTVYRDKNQSGNSLCALNIQCEKNCVYRFCFVVENDQGASICVGVTGVDPRDIKTSGIGNIYSSPQLHIFRSFQGMLYSRGKELGKHLEEFWMTGTLLEMTINTEETTGAIQYSINGNDQGIAFSDLELPLIPVVAFYAGMEKRLTLIHFEGKRKTISAIPQPNRFTGLKSLESTPDKLSIIEKRVIRDKCRVCSKPVDCIALPCKHTHLCALCLSKRGQCQCRYKGTDFGMWNVF